MLRNAWAVVAVMAVVALLGIAPGTSTAQSRWIVSGTLDFVDDSSRTIEVNGQTLQITRVTKIKRGVEVPGTWEDVVDRDGEHELSEEHLLKEAIAREAGAFD